MDNILLSPFFTYGIRILLSFLTGLFLGIERKSRQHTVGIKTLVLISLSSCLLSILSIFMAETNKAIGDPTRIAAGVITGIGFIGGGAILRQGLNIRGLTTAAIILLTSSIGLSFGAGLYLAALITFALSLISLVLLDNLEKKLFPATKNKILCLKLEGSQIDKDKLQNIITKNGLLIRDLNVMYISKKEMVELIYTVKAPNNLDALKLATELGTVETLISFTLSDKR